MQVYMIVGVYVLYSTHIYGYWDCIVLGLGFIR